MGTVEQRQVLEQAIGFHSINVPSEWGQPGIMDGLTMRAEVSIQLMSPASGDPKARGMITAND